MYVRMYICKYACMYYVCMYVHVCVIFFCCFLLCRLPKLLFQIPTFKFYYSFLSVLVGSLKFIWLDGTDVVKEDDWKRHDGNALTYTNLDELEPNGKRGENCLAFWKNAPWRWVDITCSEKLPFVCEVDIG